MTQCNMTAQTMTHNDPQPKGILLEGEGVGPTAKGQQKRSVRKQFFIFKFFVVNCTHTSTRMGVEAQKPQALCNYVNKR
jgi:hypothetical protein